MRLSRMDFLGNLVFPRNIHCLLCGRQILPFERYSLCEECSGKLKMLSAKGCCELCGRPLSSGGFGNGCPECAGMEFHFDRAVSCMAYDDFSRKLIFMLKYGKKEYAAYHMAEMLCDRLLELDLGNFDLIVPVPLHYLRERERGFNQSSAIAEELGRMRDEAVMQRAIVRERQTLDQTDLGREKRFENLKGSFRAPETGGFEGKRVILVDDVMTTGATVDDCARALKESGAEIVVAATVACR